MHFAQRLTVFSNVVRYGGSIVIVLLICILVYRLSMAPVRGVSSAAACDRAYAEAQTREDTIAVDFLSYPDSVSRNHNNRCGMRDMQLVQSLSR